MGEFELIERYFAAIGAERTDVVQGVGDDAALLELPPGHELVACTDTLVEGRHFPVGFDAADIGWRALAVNLSDLAAMGATAAWATLALTLPALDEDWLEGFVAGFGALALAHGVRLVGGDTTRGPLTISVQALAHGVRLVGGDTTRGPLTISVQALGTLPKGGALRRRGAAPGDLLYVTGWPGDAAAGLAIIEGRLGGGGADRAALELKFRRPEPRLAFGAGLRGIASACIDVSDGLAADLGRLAAASAVGAIVQAAELPLSRALYALAGEGRAREFALGGGDDYELLFSVPRGARAALANLTARAGAPACHCIGEFVAGRGVRVVGERGDITPPRGWDHFAM